MTTTCPKCNYTRKVIDQQINADICPACGIAYQKWRERQRASMEPVTEPLLAQDITVTQRQSIFEFITWVPDNIDPASFWPRVITLLGFTVWGYYFISAGMDWEKIGGSFLHNANLAFHEFGHIFFSPLGRFMTILGGSLFQILLPLGLMLVFILQQRDNFAASIMLWWCGQNFIDVAPYIDDAQYRSLPLVGGGGEESHDWGNLLTMMNLLDKTHSIAQVIFSIGAIIIAIALVWAAYLLYLQKNKLNPL
jgi:hypothetical protein